MTPVWRKWLLRSRIPAAIAGVLCVIAGVAFGPLVRSRVAAGATARGLGVRVASVAPGFFRVRLKGVSVWPEGLPDDVVDFDEVDVSLSLFGRPRAVMVRGGTATLDGDPKAKLAELRAWRSRHAHAGAAEGGAAMSIQGEALAVRCRAPDGKKPLEVTGIDFARDQAGWHVTVGELLATEGPLSLSLASTQLDVGATGLESLDVGSAEIAYTPPPEPTVKDVDAPTFPQAPPVGATGPVLLAMDHAADAIAQRLLQAAGDGVAALPESARSTGRRPKGPKPAPAPSKPPVPLFSLPETHALRTRLTEFVKAIAPHLPKEGGVRVRALSARYERGADRLDVGPGVLAVEPKPTGVTISFRAAGGGSPGGPPPLSVEAVLPLDDGDARVVFGGGPLPLSLLGIKEGALGIIDVARASFEAHGEATLDGGGTSLTFDGGGHVRGFSFDVKKIAHDPVHGLSLSLEGKGAMTDAGELRIDRGELGVGAFRVRGSATYVQDRDSSRGTASFEVPAAACEALLTSIPEALLPDLAGATMTGTFGGVGFLQFDSARLDDLVLRTRFDDQCRMSVVPSELSKDRFARPFSHRIVHPDGTFGEETTGPGSENWVPIEEISPFMQVAVLTTEDGSFFHHHGFNPSAIRNSLVANLKAGKFIRGASTITMQLAKNLFLSREKTLSRKFEEIILTDYLEQTFTKSELMELYLNVIEFGPDLYGIGPAAQHYFGRPASELNLAESLFLSTALPHPRTSHKFYEKGELPPAWAKTLYQLMQVAAKNGKISEAELQQGLAETITFHPETAPPPPHRPPVTSSHFLGDDANDDGWTVVE